MKKHLVTLLVLISASLWYATSTQAEETAIHSTYYVSPSGNDQNAGTEAAPFKTIEKARDAVRQINQTMTGDILVIVEGGEYPIDSTLLFNEKDSGKNGHTVTYRAKAGETPLLNGGVKVKGWTPVSGTSLFQTKVTAVENFRQMYVNGSRAQRAVSASTYRGKDFYLDDSGAQVGLVLDMSPVPSYENPGDMELVQVSNWSFHRVPVNSFAAAGAGETAIVMEEPYFTWSLTSTGHNRFAFRKPFYIENAYELLDTPGEWYFNRSTDTLTYWPLSGEDMSTAEVFIPKTETLVRIRGASLTDKVENIRFAGLTFAHTTELRASTEGAFSQQASKWSGGDGAWAMKESTDYRPKSAVYLEATNNVRFENNVFKHLGGAGLDALNGVSHTLIERNVFRDISDSAIAVGDWCHNYLNTANACFWLNVSFPNGSIEAQLKRVSEYDGPTEMGLAHFTNSGNYVKFYHQNNQWKIAKVIAGVTTVIATGPAYPVANNTDYTVKFVVKDSLLEGFVNGVSQCSISGAGLGDVRSSRQVALIADNARIRFDNVQMVSTDNDTVVREDFEKDVFPAWHNIGRKWDLVADGTTRMQFDDSGVIDEEVCAQNWIKNNTTEQTAQEYWGACAISGYVTDGLVIENNRIHDTKYSGITLGFGHGFYPDSTTCVNNIVRYNDISHFNYQCYDGGAVYTTGQMPKSLIEYNYFHDSLSSHPLRGIQCDNGSGVIEMRYNVIENVKYPNGRDQRCIQFTQRLCFDLWAHDNYTNSTEERQNGGPDCRITDTTVYTAENRPAIVYAIASKTGVTVPAMVSEDFEAGAGAWSNNGGNWSVISNGDHEYQVDNNEGTCYAMTDDRYVNVTVEAKVKLDKAYVPDAGIGLIARYTDSDNVYRFFHNKESWKLLKRVGGTTSILAEGPNTTLASGTEVEVRFVVNGSTLEGTVNGVLQCRVTDTDLVSGKSGLYSFKSKGSFDDVVIGAIDLDVSN
ncbi:right-handed parallel beta-helix repeat-containing protein [Planctomycetota bacterium]